MEIAICAPRQTGRSRWGISRRPSKTSRNERLGVIPSSCLRREGGVAGQRGFFDLDERYAARSKAGDPLVRLFAVVDTELFRADIDAGLERSERVKGGRPAIEAVLVLQILYGLADAQAVLQILGDRSFGRCLGINDGDRVPDGEARARNRSESRAERDLAVPGGADHGRRHGAALRLVRRASARAGLSRHGRADRRCLDRGRAAPAHDRCRARNGEGRRHPRRVEGQAREAPPEGSGCPVDREARPGRRAHGPDRNAGLRLQKSHISTDRRHGFIRRCSVTDAAHQGGRELPGLLDRTSSAAPVRGDTAYRSQKNERRASMSRASSRRSTFAALRRALLSKLDPGVF